MNSKAIARRMKSKLDKWAASVTDESVRAAIKENAIVTGGALVSMLNNETPNDYDIYFKTKDSALAVARYYATIWNETHPEKNQVQVLLEDETGRITAFVRSTGFVAEDGEVGIDDETEPEAEPLETEMQDERPPYRPRYFSTNAISLSDGIQIVIRFYGNIGEIHTNYDFVHCTCSYDYKTGVVDLPARALEAIINKELYYMGSKYPLCSIIRTRKFVSRGWTINAGQYLKMCLQLNELNLKDLDVFSDQLAGVDSVYFNKAIEAIRSKQEENPDFQVDNSYLFEVINRIF